MRKIESGRLWKVLTENRYVLLVLLLGLVLLLLPRGRSAAPVPAATGPPQGIGDPLEASGIPLDTEAERLAEVLEGIRGVGAPVRVLLSRNGAVVVCAGGSDARVRLDVTNAVSAYTGLDSDKITIYVCG